MSNLTDVRLIIADPPQFDRAVAKGDGISVQFPLPNVPVVTGTVSVWVGGIATVPTLVDVRTGVVTLAVPPILNVEVVISYNWAVLLDGDIDAFLALEGSNVKLAAAQALDTIASSEAMVQKRITLLDLQTDGPATARALRDHASALRKQVAVALAIVDPEGMFDIAEIAIPPFTGYLYSKTQGKEWSE